MENDKLQMLTKLHVDQTLEVTRCEYQCSLASIEHVRAADKLAIIDWLIREAQQEASRLEEEEMQRVMKRS